MFVSASSSFCHWTVVCQLMIVVEDVWGWVWWFWFWFWFSDSRLVVCVFLFQISRKDFDGFKKLFHRFLQVKGPSVEWPKINRPPEDSVSSRYQRSHCLPEVSCCNAVCCRSRSVFRFRLRPGSDVRTDECGLTAEHEQQERHERIFSFLEIHFLDLTAVRKTMFHWDEVWYDYSDSGSHMKKKKIFFSHLVSWTKNNLSFFSSW